MDEEEDEPFDFSLAAAIICERFRISRDEVRRFDGEAFFWHYEQAQRLRAMERMDMLMGVFAAAASAFAGGEQAQDLANRLDRVIRQIPNARMKADAYAAYRAFLAS